MDIRKYNIYFHTHTISGIIIAALLYVIFFAGSFSFFKDDISAWQKGKSAVVSQATPDYNYLMDSLAQHHNLRGRSFDFYVLRQGQGTYVNMSASQDTTVSKPKPMKKERARGRGRGGDDDSAYFLFHFADKTPSNYADGYDMGEFLYRLHFLAQLNQIGINIGTPFGYLIAGIVSFMFLFALITGLLLHWDKIKSNFFIFRPWSKWKTIWTDMHTALGVIGFPFQLMYAITGLVLIVNVVLIAPFTKLLYNGDSEKIYEGLQYNRTTKTEYSYQPMTASFDMNAFIEKWQKEIKGGKIASIHIGSYLDQHMQVSMDTKPDPKSGFAGSGFIKVEVASGKVLEQKSLTADTGYIDWIKGLVYHLHFGDFGGIPLRMVFFVLGLMGCVVITSGIMIWLVARDKPSIPAYKRKFNFWASNVFMAACLSMLPVTAFTFIMLKILPQINQSVIYSTYFYSWLVLGLYFVARRDLPLMNRQTLLFSAILCLGVPLANGIFTNLWIWNTWKQGAFDILFIDFLFLTLSGLCAFSYLKVKAQARPFTILSTKVSKKLEKDPV